MKFKKLSNNSSGKKINNKDAINNYKNSQVFTLDIHITLKIQFQQQLIITFRPNTFNHSVKYKIIFNIINACF